jgi:hypothetical protein
MAISLYSFFDFHGWNQVRTEAWRMTMADQFHPQPAECNGCL